MHPNQGNHPIAYGGTSPMEEIGAGLQSHSLPCGGVTSLGPGGFYPISCLSALVEFFSTQRIILPDAYHSLFLLPALKVDMQSVLHV